MGFNLVIRLFLLIGAIQVIAALPKWTPIANARILSMTLTHPGVVQSYNIPYSVPNSAKAVLIYAVVRCGYSGPDTSQNIAIYTEGLYGYPRYKKYLFVHSYPQKAYSFNSDNMWFPMPTNRKVYVTYPTAMSLSTGCRLTLDAIGYY